MQRGVFYEAVCAHRFPQSIPSAASLSSHRLISGTHQYSCRRTKWTQKVRFIIRGRRHQTLQVASTTLWGSWIVSNASEDDSSVDYAAESLKNLFSSMAKLPITPKPITPKPIRTTRIQMSQKLAVLLLRSGYEQCDDMDIVAMDKFQVA